MPLHFDMLRAISLNGTTGVQMTTGQASSRARRGGDSASDLGPLGFLWARGEAATLGLGTGARPRLEGAALSPYAAASPSGTQQGFGPAAAGDEVIPKSDGFIRLLSDVGRDTGPDLAFSQ